MEPMERSKCWRLMFGACIAMASAACSKPQIDCGGGVYPKTATDSELHLVNIAKVEAAEFCGQADSGCDFSVYKTRAGVTVKARRMVAHDGRCVNFIGDERFYSFDKSGRLEGLIKGL